MANYKTFKEEGYTYLKNLGDGQHLLQTSEGTKEVFAANKNHASWGLIYKNTHLEFCYSINE